jgi:hypothetical protein
MSTLSSKTSSKTRESQVRETKLVVEHREHLWNLLIQAAQVEHMIMCQYLWEPLPGLVTAAQAAAGIAAQLAEHVPAELRPASSR